MKRWIAIVLCLILVPVSSVLAQNESEEIHELEEVVVTATHKMKILDTPASISIVTSNDLEEMGAKNIVEALRRVPGVIDTTASDPSVSIRGQISTMAGGPVVLIDGVPQKIGSFRYDQLDFIPVSQVERIEVLKSTGIAFGPGSARGVINIITKKGHEDKPFSGDVSALYGSWNTHREAASLFGRIDKWDYFANLANFETDGYEDEHKEQLAGLLKFGYNLLDSTRIGLNLSSMSLENEAARGRKKYKEQLENYRREKHFYESDKLVWHDEKDKEVFNVGLDLSHNSGKMFVNADINYTKYDNEYNWSWDKFYYADYSGRSNYKNERGDIEKENQDMYTSNISGGYNFLFGNISYTPSVGIRYEDIDFETRRTYPYDQNGSTADKKASYDIDLDEIQYGIFWDNDFLFGENVGLKIGGRMDVAEIEYENKTPLKFDKKEEMFGWSVAPSYHFSDKANLYLLAEKKFWLPTPYYYKSALEYRNESIDPEETITYEIGYKHQVSKAFNIALAVFSATCKDKIATRYDDDGDSNGMDNVGETETNGIELEIDGRISQLFGYHFAGHYMDIEWTDGKAKAYGPGDSRSIPYNLDGYDVYGIPNYVYSAGIDLYPTDGLKFSVDVETQGPYYIDYLNQFEHSSETTVNAMVSYNIKNWKLWLLGKNILDEEIEHEFNASGKRNSSGDSNSTYYVQDGAYFEAGLSYQF